MKIISYFSYKGGAGRSTLAYNTIPILASEYFRPTKESPMIVVDMDIEIWKQLIYHKNKWMSKSLKALIDYIKVQEFSK